MLFKRKGNCQKDLQAVQHRVTFLDPQLSYNIYALNELGRCVSNKCHAMSRRDVRWSSALRFVCEALNNHENYALLSLRNIIHKYKPFLFLCFHFPERFCQVFHCSYMCYDKEGSSMSSYLCHALSAIFSVEAVAHGVFRSCLNCTPF